MITVDDPRHRTLENDVTEFLHENGFLTAEATYHAVMPTEVKDRLARVYTPSALYLRTRADRVAIHCEQPVCFEWECKTRHPRTRAKNMAIEAFPLAQHVFKARLGVRVLYVYRDDEMGFDVGFWAHALPPIDCIMVPRRGDGIAEYLSIAFPGVGQVPISETAGSGDPFVVVHPEMIQNLADWRMEIVGELHQ